MATGRLGTNALAATTLTNAYTVPAGTYSVVNVSFTNTAAASVTIRLLVGASTTLAPIASEYIEYNTTIIGNGVFERTGLVLDAGRNVIAYASAAGVNVNVYGIETSTS